MDKQFIHPNNIVPDKTFSMNGVRVNKYLIADHNINNLALPSTRTYKLKGVTIHNTSTLGKDDDAKWYVCSTENGNMGGVFVQVYCDYNGAWQILPWTSMNWSCSDGIDYAGGNTATIALEIIMDSPRGTNNLKAMDNGARIAAYILYKYGLTANDLYTHSYWINTKIYGATGTRDYLNTLTNPRKNCPVYIIPQWEQFKRKVDSYIVQLGGQSIYEEVDPDSSYEDVQLIYQAVSSAAIRAGMSKSAKIYGRVTKGDYYPIDRKYSVDGNVWLRYAGQDAYSMLNDGGALFRRTAAYSTKRTTCKVNIRDKASLKGNKVDTLPEKTIVYMWAGEPPVLVDGYHWAKIIYEGKICYIASEYLK